MSTVSEIWRYPVKSMGGERLESAAVDELGVAGDRQWGVLDSATGLMLTGRRVPELLMLSATLVDGRPVITTVDGSRLDGDTALSEQLGRRVELRSAADGPGTFENPMDIDRETDWVTWQSSGATLHDGRSTVSLVPRTSLGNHDARRFRINLILDDAEEHDEEDDLTGEVRVGGVTLRIRKPIERCIMVARAQPGLPSDLGVLKQVIRERDNKLGVGAVVTMPGTIAVGDELTSG
jgi:uncharacterized protein YcbX